MEWGTCNDWNEALMMREKWKSKSGNESTHAKTTMKMARVFQTP
jgi:hypothetical protein